MATDENPHPWSLFWTTLTQFDKAKMNPWMGLRNAIGVALPLAAGIAAGQPIAGALMSTGALNVAFSDGQDPYGQRARRMLASSVLGAFAIFAGSLSGENTLAAAAVTTVWALIAGMMVALGTGPTDLATISLVALIVFHARPMDAPDAALAGLAALAGGLLQTGIALALWPVRPYEPQRRELSNLYRELAGLGTGPVDGFDSPAASLQITNARQVLDPIARQHSLESDRIISLLNQAERIRLSMITLGRLLARMRRDEKLRDASEVVERFLALGSEVLASVAETLSSGAPVWQGALSHSSDRLREISESDTEDALGLAASARYQIDAFEGQLRAVIDLASKGAVAMGTSGAEEDWLAVWSRQWHSSMATLRANLNLDSAALRHAIRMAACVAFGEALGRSLSWQRTYWLPMTVAIVLKPDFTATFSRGLLRLAGTFAGLVIATLLFNYLHTGVGSEILLVAALTFGLRWAGPSNYGILVTAISALVVVLVAITGVSPHAVILARGLNTVAGGILALAAYTIWPTWERTQIRQAMASMLDSYREYFRIVSQTYQQPGAEAGERLISTRMAARLKRSNMEASFDRLSAEPGVTARAVSAWSAMLASSHGMVVAIMALDAALPSSGDDPAPDVFRTFSNDVEITLHSISRALRGEPHTAGMLPDLREDHRRVAECTIRGSGRAALVAMETDRLANRINTLSMQVSEWIAVQPTPIAFGPS